MKIERTPDPWVLLRPDQVRGPQGEFVADCQCGLHGRKADIGNAMLISASPELLAACKSAYEKLCSCEFPGRGTAEGQLLLCNLRDAIQKSETL